jgi:hypothetical protein
MRVVKSCSAAAISASAARKGGIGMRSSPIFIVLFAMLAMFWLGGFLIFHVASAMIHLLLVFALISLVLHFMRRSATP